LDNSYFHILLAFLDLYNQIVLLGYQYGFSVFLIDQISTHTDL